MAEKILIVDDDVDSLKLIGLMLKRQGYEVTVADSGGKALKKADEERPNLIILDVMMPDMDGVELVRQLADRNMPLPIIVMSGNEQIYMQIIEMIARQSGIEILGTLNKPFHVAQLETCLKPMLGEMVN